MYKIVRMNGGMYKDSTVLARCLTLSGGRTRLRDYAGANCNPLTYYLVSPQGKYWWNHLGEMITFDSGITLAD